MQVNICKALQLHSGEGNLIINDDFSNDRIVKISGPSGAGKTTFLKIIAGLITPDSGSICYKGQTWLDTERRIDLSPQQRGVGFVFQDYALFPNMTVGRHLEYAGAIPEWANTLLALGELKNLRSVKPARLSGGQQQRLAILRALAPRPSILLMDEPFSALDRQTKSTLIGNLKPLFEQMDMKVFIVSHNQAELDSFAGRQISIGE
jgi:molybdate transport system ATP-binding protein